MKRKSFDLDNHDAFWQRHKGAPFPEVAENIQTELNDYRSKADDIERMKQGGNSIEKCWLKFRLEKRLEIPF